MTIVFNSTLEAAKYFHSMGINVIPLLPQSKDPDFRKLPKYLDPETGKEKAKWKEYQERRTTDNEIEDWYKEGSDSGIGLVGGEISNNFVALDFESEESYRKFFSKHEDLEKTTIVVKTARGYHVYLFSNKPVLSYKIPEVSLDVQAEGKYVVAPPSIHPTGIQYKIISESKEITTIDNVVEAINKHARESGYKPKELILPTGKAPSKKYIKTIAPCIQSILEQGVVDGERDETAFLLARYLKSMGFQAREANARIEGWNKKNKPPLPDWAIRKCVNSAYSNDYPVGCSNPYMQKHCALEKCDFYKAKGEIEIAPIVLNEDEKQAARQLLENPEILAIIDEEIHYELVGETKNALQVFLTCLSAKTDDPLNLRFSGRSSIGKNAIIRAVTRLFPSEMIIKRMSISKKSLIHDRAAKASETEPDTFILDLTGKVLIILEEENSREFLEEIKPILSHDEKELSTSVVIQSPKGLRTKHIIIKGHPAYIGLTTSTKKSEEQQSRATTTTPDMIPQKYQAVQEWETDRVMHPWEVKPSSNTLKIIQNAIRLIEPEKIWIPYADICCKHFPSDNPKTMRDYRRLLSYFKAVTTLYQYQRPTIEVNGCKYRASAPYDAKIAYSVIESMLMELIISLPRDVLDFYNFLAEQNPNEELTIKDLVNLYKKCFKQSITRNTLIPRYIEPLMDFNLLERDETGKPYKYFILNNSLSKSVNTDNILSEIFSDETKAKLISDSLSIKKVEHGVENTILALYAPNLIDKTEKVLNRPIEQEYPKKLVKSKLTENDKPVDIKELCDDCGKEFNVTELTAKMGKLVCKVCIGGGS